MNSIAALVLAGGNGKRMGSSLPKVLHRLAGTTLLSHVLHNLSDAGVEQFFVVVGYKATEVMQAHAEWPVMWVMQRKQRGTGDAVKSAKYVLQHGFKDVIVINGDAPLISPHTILSMVYRHAVEKAVATVLACNVSDPTGRGRLLRDESHNIFDIIEEKDANNAQRTITEVNCGLYVFSVKDVFPLLELIGDNNESSEHYLTDIVNILYKRDVKVNSFQTKKQNEVSNVNTLDDLALAEEIYHLTK